MKGIFSDYLNMEVNQDSSLLSQDGRQLRWVIPGKSEIYMKEKCLAELKFCKFY